jgi:imidazole glycerol phosphate synthase subunit HisF
VVCKVVKILVIVFGGVGVKKYFSDVFNNATYSYKSCLTKL